MAAGVVLDGAEAAVTRAAALGLKRQGMNKFIDELHGAMQVVSNGAEEISLDAVKLDAPIPEPKQDIICLGLNYRDHAEEATRADAVFDVQRGDAVYFAKRLNKAVASGDTSDGHFDICDSLDYEVELGVVLGKDAKNVKAADAAGNKTEVKRKLFVCYDVVKIEASNDTLTENTVVTVYYTHMTLPTTLRV